MKSLRVTGKGKIVVAPDRVSVSFRIIGRSGEFERAVEQTAMRVNTLQQVTSESGLDLETLKTTNFQIEVETKYQNGEHIRVGYACTHSLLISLPMDSATLGRYIGRVIAARVEAKTSFSFDCADAKIPPLLAIEAATKDARIRAERIAETSGCSLGQILRIEHGNCPSVAENRSFPIAEEGVLAESMPDLPAFRPEGLTFEEEVSVEWELLGAQASQP